MANANEVLERPARRSFLISAGTAAVGMIGAGLLAGCGSSSSSSSPAPTMDASILNAAATAEALATTMYDNIINSNIYTSGLAGNGLAQGYLNAALEQELNHYNLLLSLGAKPLTTTFYFPPTMFGGSSSYQTTINTLITLEDAFIAAYLIAVRDFSMTSNKVVAAQILGVESEHRVLGRDVALFVGLSAVTGLSGNAESVTPPGSATNNLAYERTFSAALPNIAAVVTALGPFVNPRAAGYVAPPIPFSTTINSPVQLSDTTP